MTNTITLSGTIMDTPNLRTTKNGKSFVTFRIKVDRENSTFKDYINCVSWDNDLAQKFARDVNQNDEITLTGSMHSNRYTNNQGATCYTYEVATDKYQVLKKAPAPVYQPNNGSFNQPMQTAQPTTTTATATARPFPKTDGFNQPMPNATRTQAQPAAASAQPAIAQVQQSAGPNINDPLADVPPANVSDDDLPF